MSPDTLERGLVLTAPLIPSVPHSPHIRIVWGAASNRGTVRPANEDAWLAAENLWAVADGMGGHSRGANASATAVRVLAEALDSGRLGGRIPDVADLDRAVSEAAVAVAQLAIAADPTRSPGTTLTAGTVIPMGEGGASPHWVVLNIGDSRAWAVSESGIHQVTTDHSILQEAKDLAAATGIEVVMPPANVVTRALGAASVGVPTADFFALPLRDRDRLVLTTDGVHGVLTPEEILSVVRENDPQTGADLLVEMALGAGSRDNATAVIVHVEVVVATQKLDNGAAGPRRAVPVTPAETTTAPRRYSEGGS